MKLPEPMNREDTLLIKDISMAGHANRAPAFFAIINSLPSEKILILYSRALHQWERDCPS